ncbi:hypothetical protein PNOK_0672200 [Pyrrhoderma noxium]|uniref:Uncharacterized protein n=1 Tax=Pyrrhoderma noxium TaxID=2282107 RepID=A0A286UF54_9AGAM|nr:hypothetical protein PNOK_0672200 [Pyrrhoderma noxium]
MDTKKDLKSLTLSDINALIAAKHNYNEFNRKLKEKTIYSIELESQPTVPSLQKRTSSKFKVNKWATTLSHQNQGELIRIICEELSKKKKVLEGGKN